MAELTKQQREAVMTIDRDLVVSAGAGSGKTRVLVERYLYLLSQGVKISDILAITFTRKAALEMKQRIRNALIERGAPQSVLNDFTQAHISTIHGFCQRIVADHPCQAGIDPRFRVAEEWESRSILSQVVQDLLADYLAQGNPEITALRESFRQSAMLVDYLIEIYQRMIAQGARDFRVPDQSAELLPQMILCRNEFITQLGSWLNSLDLQALSAAKQETVESLSSLLRVYQADQQNQDEEELLQEFYSLLGGNWAKTLKDDVQRLRDLCGELRQLIIDQQGNQILQQVGDLLTQIDQEYTRRKTAAGIVDFNDLELLAKQLLAAHAIDHTYHFQHVMVDEAQDVNPIQTQIIELLTAKPGAKLFIVGDPKQSIYRFRGAQVEVFMQLQEKIKVQGQHIHLQDNFRSRRHLIEFSNQFFPNLFSDEKIIYETVTPQRADAEQCTVELLISPKQDNLVQSRAGEAQQIAAYISKLVSQGYRYRDITILLRSMTNVSVYERALHEHGIPFVNLSGRGFYQRPEIQDVLNFVKWLQDASDAISKVAVLRSPFFAVSDAGLYWYQVGKWDQISMEDQAKLELAHNLYPELQKALVTLPAPYLLEKLLTATDFCTNTLGLPMGQQRLANINKLQDISWQLWAKGYTSFNEQLNYIAEVMEQQAREGEARLDTEVSDVVTIMTIHGSKGLEFPVVILPDLCTSFLKNEGSLLHYHSQYGLTIKDTSTYQKIKALLREEAASEAKRLLYVAITRAQEQLVLSGIGNAEDYDLERPLAEMTTWWEWILALCRQVDPALLHIIDTEEHKQAAVQANEVAAADEQNDVGTLPLTQPKYALASFSVTSLMVYGLCPRRYFYRYILRVPEIIIDGKVQNTGEGLNPLARGNIVHRVCEHLNAGTDPEQLLDWAIAMEGVKVNAQQRSELQDTIQRYLASRYYQLGLSYSVSREVEFTVPLENYLITGTVDQVIDTGSDLIIVDLKTNHITPEQVESTAVSYSWQLRIYAWALQKLLGKPVKEVSLYFLFPNQVYKAPESYLDIAATEKWLLSACRTIQSSEVKGAAGFPMAEHCYFCPYDCQHLVQAQESFGEIVAGLGKLEWKQE